MPTEEQWLEIHRLAVRGQSAAIAHEVGTRLTGSWLGVSRFREVRALSLQTLSLGLPAPTTVHLARAKYVLGERQEALTLYREALQLYEAVGDRAGESVIPSNMAMIYRPQGRLAAAVEALRQVVALDEQTQHPDLESDTAMLCQVEQEWQACGP
jgi:tetratricopeptide (TPR) repeat protein